MTVTVPGYSSVSGKPLVIAHLLRLSAVYVESNNLSFAEYTEAIERIAADVFETPLNVTGGTVEARAESLLREMSRAGMIEIEEETS